MKNLLNKADREEIVSRIQSLTSDHKGQWGKMDVGQMLAHLQKPMELALQSPKPPRSLMGRIMGPFVKKGVIGDIPFKRDGYTPPPFKISGPMDFHVNKDKLLKLIERFPKEMPAADKVHPFFGPLTLDEYGQSQFKHLDYHLGQFGV